MRRNVDVLMDRAPADAEAAARAAIAEIDPPVELRRLRMRQAAGRHFADVVIGVPPGAAVGQGHAAADAVESALERALPESDVVVHVEPVAERGDVRERAQAAALGVPRVREIHNITVVDLDGRPEISLHLKLPGDLSLDEAHDVAEEVERAIARAVPDVATSRRTSSRCARRPPAARRSGAPARRSSGSSARRPGQAPRDVRFLRDGRRPRRARQHRARRRHAARGGARTRERDRGAIRRERPELSDVVIHTEP